MQHVKELNIMFLLIKIIKQAFEYEFNRFNLLDTGTGPNDQFL